MKKVNATSKNSTVKSTKTTKNAKPAKTAKTAKLVSVSISKVRGKTSRATMINVMLSSKGKVVPVATLKTAVAKATGLQPETVESRLKSRVKLIAAWAKSHGFSFNATNKGMSLTLVKG